MLREQLAVLELLKNLIRGKTEGISRVTYTPQKPSFYEGRRESSHFPRAVPEAEGVSSRLLADFIREAAGDRRTDLHHVMVLRHGRVIAEASIAPYQKDVWHASYSMCKSVVGMAVGMLIDEGKLRLEDKVLKLLESRSLLAGLRQKNLTVEQLLTMSTGVAFNELGIVSGDDWVSGYLQSPAKGAPGEKFEYNSMNTYILSAVVTKVTGETLTEYLRPRLWEPLGIRNVFWEACPKGITKGGWGLFITTEDAAKLGQLYLQKGVWNGKRLLSEEWVRAATEKHIETPESMGPYGYGYQVWMGGRPGSYTFNGMLGQNVVVYPDLDMVIALNAGSDELFQNCILLNIVKKYFEEGSPAADTALPADPAGRRALLDLERALSVRPVWGGEVSREHGGWPVRGEKRCRRKNRILEEERMKRFLDGRVYLLSDCHVGLAPLVLQVFHNNYTEGIRRAAFYYERGRFYLALEEGETLHRIQVGFGRAAVSEVLLRGEPYLLGTTGEFTRDEDGRTVLKVDMAFLEEAVRRRLKCVFDEKGETIEMRWDELPGSRMITEGLGALLGDSLRPGIMEALKEWTGADLPAILVERTVRPVAAGVLARDDS